MFQMAGKISANEERREWGQLAKVNTQSKAAYKLVKRRLETEGMQCERKIELHQVSFMPSITTQGSFVGLTSPQEPLQGYNCASHILST